MAKRTISRLFTLIAGWPLAACTLQPVYTEPVIDAFGTRPAGSIAGFVPRGFSSSDMWWRKLNDPAIDQLVLATLASSPTMEQALAKVQVARASAGIAEAAVSPTLAGNGFAGKAQAQASTGGPTMINNVRAASLNLSWEVDLFGKVRESRNAAARRIDARTADARLAQLSLTTQVVNGVVATRACLYSLKVRQDDITSREVILNLIRKKREAGFLSAVNESRAMADLASSQTAFLSQKNTCSRGMNELVFLSGLPLEAVKEYLPVPAAYRTEGDIPGVIPPPQDQSAIPASVLRFHPRVMAVERDVAAAYADIGVARAERYPTISLTAALAGQWIGTGGNSINTTNWSVGPSITGAILDGGASASKVDAATARWKIAVGVLNSEIRSAAQDIQNALADQESANARIATASIAVTAARNTMRATEAQWRAGAVSLFELEDATRQFEVNEETQIVALRDRTQAWVALIKATANAVAPSKDPT